MSFMDDLRIIAQHYPDTPDGTAHLHTVILDGIEKNGLENTLKPDFIAFLAKQAATYAATYIETPRPKPRPQLQLLQGGRNG
jgi:hypothetical protein